MRWHTIKKLLANNEIVECTDCRKARLLPCEKDAANEGFNGWRRFMRRMHETHPESYQKNLSIQKAWFSKDVISACEILEPKVPFRFAWIEIGGAPIGYHIADGMVTKWHLRGHLDTRVGGFWALDENGALPPSCEESWLLKANAIAVFLTGRFSKKISFIGTDRDGDVLPAGAESGRAVKIIRVGENDISTDGMRAAIEAAKKRKHSVRGHYRHLERGAVYVRPHERGIDSDAEKITDLKFE